MAQKRKLNYIFHNPNTPEETADFLADLFVEVNKAKAEESIREALKRYGAMSRSVERDSLSKDNRKTRTARLEI